MASSHRGSLGRWGRERSRRSYPRRCGCYEDRDRSDEREFWPSQRERGREQRLRVGSTQHNEREAGNDPCGNRCPFRPSPRVGPIDRAYRPGVRSAQSDQRPDEANAQRCESEPRFRLRIHECVTTNEHRCESAKHERTSDPLVGPCGVSHPSVPSGVHGRSEFQRAFKSLFKDGHTNRCECPNALRRASPQASCLAYPPCLGDSCGHERDGNDNRDAHLVERTGNAFEESGRIG